jgi:hypothetical protein
MAGVAAGMGLFGIFVILVLILYPYLALGRIWLYSKQQVVLLREIKAALERQRSGGTT